MRAHSPRLLFIIVGSSTERNFVQGHQMIARFKVLTVYYSPSRPEVTEKILDLLMVFCHITSVRKRVERKRAKVRRDRIDLLTVYRTNLQASDVVGRDSST
uniref:Secreted protein n=1 Tax=Steinernema glaseri TaxID=37863 RepID=A0A1I7YRS8_9BILA